MRDYIKELDFPIDLISFKGSLYSYFMDIKSPTLLKVKGLLFLLLGILAVVLLIIDSPDWRTVGLIIIVIWAFSRFYYFAFYVLHHYADKDFKYSGLIDLARYLLKK